MTGRLSPEDLQASNIAKALGPFAFAADFYLLAHEYIAASERFYKVDANLPLGLTGP
jgi:hypothetical protein